jgi:hypothetical protein
VIVCLDKSSQIIDHWAMASLAKSPTGFFFPIFSFLKKYPMTSQKITIGWFQHVTTSPFPPSACRRQRIRSSIVEARSSDESLASFGDEKWWVDGRRMCGMSWS